MLKSSAAAAAVLLALMLPTTAEVTLSISFSTVLTQRSTGVDPAGLNGATLKFDLATSQTNYFVRTFSIYDFGLDDFVSTQVNCLSWDTIALTISGSTAGNDGVYALTSSSAFYAIPNLAGSCFVFFPSNQSTPTNLGVASPNVSLSSYAEGPLAVATPALGAVIRTSDFSTAGFDMHFISGIYGDPANSYSLQGSSHFVAVPEPGAWGGGFAGLLGLIALTRRRRNFPAPPHPSAPVAVVPRLRDRLSLATLARDRAWKNATVKGRRTYSLVSGNRAAGFFGFGLDVGAMRRLSRRRFAGLGRVRRTGREVLPVLPLFVDDFLVVGNVSGIRHHPPSPTFPE